MLSHHKKLPPLKRYRLYVFVAITITITILYAILTNRKYRSEKTSQIILDNQASTEPGSPQQCGLENIVSQGQKVAVNRTKTVLISAYREHRTGREVRVLAVVLRSETVSYRCLLCCHNQVQTSEGFSNIHSDHFGFAYGTADIMCPLPSSCDTPSYITVTSAAAADSEGHLDKLEFLEVKNRKVRSESFPYSFTVCLSTMFDFTNVLQLVQSLEMLQFLGVNRVVIYKTNSSPEVQSILDYYMLTGLVEVIPWSWSRFLNVSKSWLPEHGPGDLHYFGQIPALNDCLYRYMYESRYVALQDIDELILPQSVNSWLELLPLLEQKYGADLCYEFENNVFPNNIALPSPISQTLNQQSQGSPDWKNVPGVNILDHLYYEPQTTEAHYSNFKIIINPRAAFSVSVHGVLASQHGCVWVDRNIARMYHTRAPKQPELTPNQLIYDGRMLSYSARLTPKVNAVLRESGLYR